ncbi:hypothetical protein C806_01867 [Lachnospiraceae bacterium 3-1]|nr:hypothetical protein C806_01867 [Lachnospiraceae bacterium 3-1]
MEKVQVLLSTYQGEQFLEEQMESLLGQTWKNLEILVRDDGSKDNTQKILEHYSEKYDNIRYYPGKNVGVAKSFFELLKKSDAEFVAFCDQDDVWLENKIEAAVDRLKKEKGPALYCSNKILVDRNLCPMKKQNQTQLRPGFGNAVVECICTGCTAVLNRELADILSARLPEHAILHDWWTYLAASYVGSVIFDSHAYILYRQHEQNVVGAKGGFWGAVQSKAAYLRKNHGKLKGQLTDFSRLYQGDKKKDALVQKILAAEKLPGRIRLLGNREMFRQSVLDEVIMRILFLINRML